jgi:transcriptional regulator with XRE-family HTH domain
VTLEIAAERLARPPFNLDYTHNSLGRIENGKQMPTIELIEALAKMYETDIDSLLNRRPETGPTTSAKGLLQLWDKAGGDERSLIIDVAKRVVKTGT